ncbi:hypothetical protein [Caulobacter phage KSC]|uniref:Uncharacterized protein n=1 Tax=Caulobacter phage KSC TaxID=3020398 RepID=A0AAE9X2X3_9CAUD|nr:hypothetical protein [Caulobacter phage KSC]
MNEPDQTLSIHKKAELYERHHIRQRFDRYIRSGFVDGYSTMRLQTLVDLRLDYRRMGYDDTDLGMRPSGMVEYRLNETPVCFYVTAGGDLIDKWWKDFPTQ